MSHDGVKVGSPTGSAMFGRMASSGGLDLKEVASSRSGYLWKQGTRFKRFKKRYYRIVDNFLYYSHREEDEIRVAPSFLMVFL